MSLALFLLGYGRMIGFLLFLLFLCPAAQAAEPSVRDVQEEAVRYLGFNQGRMEGWEKRARWAAALPRLQAGFQKDLKDVVSLTTRDNISVTEGQVFVGPNENSFDKNFNQATSFEVKAVWFLDELIFTRDSLAASAEKRDWIRERARVLQGVTEAYFTRKRLAAELKQKADPAVIREKKKLMLDQANGTLDALTGGWFSRHMEKGFAP